MAGLTTLQLLCKDIAYFIKLGGLTALSGNDKRCTCLVNQDGVDLIDDTVVKISLYKLLFVDDHIVTKVIKSKFIVCYISNVASVCCTALFRFHVVEDNAYGQSEEFMDFTHPLSISFCQVVVDSYDMDTLAFEGIQVCRKGRHEGLTFTSLHLCDLYTVMLHAKNSFRTFTNNCKSLRKKIIQCLSLVQTFTEFSGLVSQLFIC